jgi:flagellar hook protein FlgE
MGIQSFFSGVSGLEAHSTWLDVIGNNVSNANTVAYKSSRLKFADQLSATLSESQGESGSLGGVDAQQVGTGTRVSSIETLFNQGATLQTGRNLDLAIQGDGFFVVQDGDQRLYTRAGNLDLDGDGNLVDSNGAFVQGVTTRGSGTSTELYDVDKGDPPFTTIDPPSQFSTTHVTFGPLDKDADAVGNINIEPNMVLPAKDTTSLSLGGNLDAGLSATQSGGILDLAPGGQPALPLSIGVMSGPIGLTMNGFFDTTPIGADGDFALHQLQGLKPPVVGAAIPLSTAQANATNAWMQGDAYPPAATSTQTVYDQQGNARQITLLFYQVNDLGDGGINSTSGPSQAAYAWYAFDTTGGQSPSNTNLVGGTSILEGEVAGQNPQGYNRGIWGDQYTGDLLYFNSDGSLASPGANDINQLGNPPRPDIAATPRIYLPATQSSDSANGGDGITSISISFGTVGKRDGVYSDATGSYSGSVYTAQSKVQEISQDGYAQGTLQTVSVDTDGVVCGDFTNGQTGVALARLSMARFSNPEGLSKVGNNDYNQSANSGPLEMGFAGEGAIGTIQSGALEASNVDLGLEMTNMIIAQRSYELNSKTIGVSSDNWKTAVDMV